MEAQHGWLAPPQVTQAEPEQTVPFAQTLPQQGSFKLPQATQVLPVAQVAPVLQVVPQQPWPFPPHGTQVLLVLEQRYPEAQFWPGQQASPIPPQLPQVPLLQTSVETVHAPLQHVCPSAPQGRQVPDPQTFPVPQALPPQQL